MTMPLKSLLGRVLDLDSHEQIPQARYAEVFGERGEGFLEAKCGVFDMIAKVAEALNPGDGLHIDIPDTAEINEEAVWENKGSKAPSHADLDRRPGGVDMMGIQRQLVFPTMGLVALGQTQGGLSMGQLRVSSDEEKKASWDGLDAYNEWAASVTTKHPDRLRVAAILPSHKPGLTPQALVKETERLIKSGAKVLLIPVGAPPAGISPDDKRLDPFYATVAEANVALVSHPPSATGFMTDKWIVLGTGLTWNYMADEYFLSLMIMGGVFERHPTLRFGIVEAGASWVGPLSEYMDFWLNKNGRVPSFFARQFNLPMLPSEYLARNVRVTPYNFEPVEQWFQRWPHLQDVYCYSSDFPHTEGQTWSLKKFYENVAPLGDKVVEKFFCTNGRLLVA